MKVLLTGATGFIGSHILESLRSRGLATAILLRPTSSKRFIQRHLPEVELRFGSLNEPASLQAAMAGITHVIHCAGCTKAQRISEFHQTNEIGTRNVVAAANTQVTSMQRFVHISSLAAVGPAIPDKPARESDTPRPVSAYGKSKLAAELEVRNHCRAPFVILRPPAVYGPGDVEFLRLFKAVKNHLLPKIGRRQALSMVFVRDLAEAVVPCLEHPAAAGKTFFVANREIVSAQMIADEIAAQMHAWTVPLPLPAACFWALCLAQEFRTRLTGKANILSMQKWAEFRAVGWVCDPALLRQELGYECATPLKAGIAASLNWYREQRWL